MATRHERAANKQLNEEHSRVLRELMAQPGNRVCVDCRRRDPRWASWNLGVFFCIRCSGHHRALGTHISKVKSADLDTWTPEQVASMVRWGNARANVYWEHQLPKGYVPDDREIESFIRAKYERKKFAAARDVPPPESIPLDGTSIAAPTATSSLQPTPTAKTNPASVPAQSNTSSLLADIFDSLGPPPTSNAAQQQHLQQQQQSSQLAQHNASPFQSLQSFGNQQPYQGLSFQPTQPQQATQLQQKQQQQKTVPTVDDLLMF